MGKVSIGLRGWRFDEADLFTADGEWRPLPDIPEDPRHRLVRLKVLLGKPCDACSLAFDDTSRAREATIVYGEPLNEVVLCDTHEPDFLYWFREAGGEAFAGEPALRDRFHEWFLEGGRAPDGYGGLEHVETAPADLPDLPDPEAVFEAEEDLLADRADTDAEAATDGSDDDDLDLGREYPTG